MLEALKKTSNSNRLVYPVYKKDRLSVWQNVKGLLLNKKNKVDPIKELEALRKGWDRKFS